jgi:hypothetical protein
MKNSKKIVCLLFAMLALNTGTFAQKNTIAAAVNAVIANYLGVKTALAANDGTAAETKAVALLATLNSVPTGGLSSDETALIAKLQYDSRHISEVNRIAHQREHFVSLSDNLYTLLKKLKVNSTTIYREYCTMNKSHYLSDNEKAADPYMGMTTCSKTVETLKPAK